VAIVAAGALSQALAEKKEVKIVYVEWSSEVASTNLVKAVIQEKLGHKCVITPVSAAAMWQSVATGDQDGMVAAWLPTTHGHYLEKLKDKVVDLGPNLEGTRIGLVVPTYVAIKSIGEMKDNVKKFEGKIIGIDPGAGIMSKTETAIDEYGLDSYTLVEGSDATMCAALANAMKGKEWIAITGWTPHWKWARWDLKYLDDPKNIYGGEEFINTVVRKGLKEDMPDIYAFLDKFHWTPTDMAELMVWNNEDGADPYKNALKWMKENPDKVEAWLK
jgi:glycine betaine/proline transport system substrate-binding protein